MRSIGLGTVVYRTAWVLVGLLLTGATIAGFGKIAGYQLLSVQSGSMRPTIYPNDAVVIRTGDRPVVPGMIISYHSAADPRVINTHRIIAVNHQANTMTTKGDNEVTPEFGISLSSISGAYIFRIPYIGRLLDALRHPVGLLLAVYVPVIGIVLEEVRRLSRYYGSYHPRHYSLYR